MTTTTTEDGSEIATPNSKSIEINNQNILSSVFLEFPLSIIKRTDLPSFQPSRDTMKVESVITDSPRYSAFFCSGRLLICLTVNT